MTKEGPGAALDKHGGDAERCRKEATDSITESVVGNGFLLKEGRKDRKSSLFGTLLCLAIYIQTHLV